MTELIGKVARGPYVEAEPERPSPSIREAGNSSLPHHVIQQMELAELTDAALEEQLAELERQLDDKHLGIRRGLDHDLSARHRALSLEVQRRGMLRAGQDRMAIEAARHGRLQLPDLALLAGTSDSRRQTIGELVRADPDLAHDLHLELAEELGGVDIVRTVTKLPNAKQTKTRSKP